MKQTEMDFGWRYKGRWVGVYRDLSREGTPGIYSNDDQVETVVGNCHITLLTGTGITSISGQPGQFHVNVGIKKFEAGAVIQTTGAVPVPPWCILVFSMRHLRVGV